MQRSSLLNHRNRCQNVVGARRKHTIPYPHQAEPDQVPALQSAAYAAELLKKSGKLPIEFQPLLKNNGAAR